MGMYLRVLLAIDQEVVDREVIHTAEVGGATCAVSGFHFAGALLVFRKS